MTALTTEEMLDLTVSDVIRKKLNENQIMERSLWRQIAKNEIRLRTSKFRNNRKTFFIALYSALFLWAFIVAPFIFDMFMPTLANEFSAVFKPVIAIIIESLMMTLFIMLLMYPLNYIYKDNEIMARETLLSTPVKSSDVFLGEFLGKAPIYTMIVLVFAPIIIGIINPIVDLTVIQYISIYGSIFGFVYFANLLGSIISSWIEHKISKGEKARDLAKAMIWIFTILIVVIMYSVMFFLNELMKHPELKNWLAFYPAQWFSNIVLYNIDPILLDGYLLNIWISLLLVISVPLTILYVSYKKAESFYTLDGGIEKGNTTIIKHENPFYKIIRRATGRKWGGLVVVQLKRFFRKKANIARIVYVVGLLGFMTWFIGNMTDGIFGAVLGSTMLIAIGGTIGSIIIGHLAFVDSKDIIWVYKRSPRGVKAIVYSYLLAMLIYNVFLALFETILFTIFGNLSTIDAVIFFIEFLLFAQISICHAMGLQCFSPAYGEKDSNMKGNTMISMLILQPVMFLPTLLLIFLDPGTVAMTRLLMQGFLFLYITGVSFPLLYFGMKKLNKIE